MSRVCDICEKSYHKANVINKLRGRYNRACSKRQRANLQSKTVDGKKMTICVNCLRTLTKKKAEKK